MSSTYGLGLARIEVTQGQNSDSLVASLAAAHLRLFPMMGLPTQLAPAAAANAMAQYVTSFAQRYGPGGTFWSQNPTLPYLPVESYEIGNEPNLPVYWVQDGTNLHWSDPSSYAQVYEAARTALHQVDPSGVAVVGGLGDTGRDGVDLPDDEQFLSALASGGVDAVGLHPYTFFVSSALMWSDTEQLRQWMNANRMQDAPIDIDEVGACDVTSADTLNTGCGTSISSADWGTFAAGYAGWALCSSALNVSSFQPEYWGDLSTTDENAILALVSGEGTLTPYGQAYLDEAQALTSNGCPVSNTSSPTVSGTPAVGSTLSASPGGWAGASGVVYEWERCDASGSCSAIPGATSSTYQVQTADVGDGLLASVTASDGSGSVVAWSGKTSAVPQPPSGGGNPSGGGGESSGGNPPPAHASRAPMLLRVMRAHARGRFLTVVVQVVPGSRRVLVIARKHGHKVRLRLTHHGRSNTSLTFTAELSTGHWMISVSCPPPAGYAAAAPAPVRVTIR